MRQELSVDADKLKLLSPGTDTQQFSPEHRDRSIWSKSGIPNDAFVFLYVGRITTEKNIDVLYRSWKRFQASGTDQNTHLAMVGYGEQKQIDKMTALPNVCWLGPSEGQELSTYYASSDAVLFPSTTETLGQVGLEAGASNVAVVASNQGGPSTYIENGKTGFLLDANDDESWTNVISDLSSRPSYAKGIGNAAGDYIREKHRIQDSFRSYWDLHQEAVEVSRYRKQLRKIRIKNKLQTLEPPPNISARGLMFVSDYHAGRRYSSPKHHNQKARAIEAMFSLAAGEDLKIIYGGDFGDHGSNPMRQEKDFQQFRKIKNSIIPIVRRCSCAAIMTTATQTNKSANWLGL